MSVSSPPESNMEISTPTFAAATAATTATTTSKHKFPHVLILGAGIGGLLLAQGLRSKGVSFEIFDRATDLSSCSDDWPVTIHSILDEIQSVVSSPVPSIDCVSSLLPLGLPAQTCFHYPNGKKFVIESSTEAKIIHADRTRWRRWLSRNISVQWRVNVDKIVENKDEDGKDIDIELWLNHGKIVRGDVLVGADGWNSQIRRYLLRNQPAPPSLWAPYISIAGSPHVTGSIFRNQLKLGHSSYNVIGPLSNASIFNLFVTLKSISEDAKSAQYFWSTTLYSLKRRRHFWYQTATRRELHSKAMDLIQILDPKFRQIVEVTKPEEMMVPSVVFRDMQVKKMPASRITLLGDAAHTVLPFRGEGGLNAMRDALDLAHILAHCDAATVVDRLGIYQDEMMSRGVKAAEKARARQVQDLYVEDHSEVP